MRRIGWIALAAYVLGLHVALAIAILHPFFIMRVLDTLDPPSGAWHPNDFWSEMVGVHKRVDASAADSVLLFGDSLVQGMDVNKVAPSAVNFGIDGDQIPGLEQRLPIYHSLPEARAVVLEIGTNDLLDRPADTIAGNYRELVERFPMMVPLIASAVLPVDERIVRCCGGFRRNGQIHQLNRAIAEICAARPNCRFVDPTAGLIDATGNLRAEFHEGDGLHLSAAGYQVWDAALRDAVTNATSTRQP